MSIVAGQQAMQTTGMAVLKLYDAQTPFQKHLLKPLSDARPPLAATASIIRAFPAFNGDRLLIFFLVMTYWKQFL